MSNCNLNNPAVSLNINDEEEPESLTNGIKQNLLSSSSQVQYQHSNINVRVASCSDDILI